MSTNALSQYRIMWIFVFYDLPTETKAQRKNHSLFRKNLIKDGFQMFQFSVYFRHCSSKENLEVHSKRVKTFMPEMGKISIVNFTDKQFERMEVFYGRKLPKNNKKDAAELKIPQQLEFF